MEPEDGQDHYTETLIRLPDLSLQYTPLDILPKTIGLCSVGLEIRLLERG